jgi:hypothetical protein
MQIEAVAWLSQAGRISLNDFCRQLEVFSALESLPFLGNWRTMASFQWLIMARFRLNVLVALLIFSNGVRGVHQP